MNKRNILIIVNPISGNQQAPFFCGKIYKELEKDKFNISIAFTGKKGDGFLLAQRAVAMQYDYVIALGGDGTVNEVASALVHTDVVMGIIPCGSGNGLARHLKIGQSIQCAVKVINGEKSLAIDYCTANDLKFFCTFGMGFDALVSYSFSKASTRGFITYMEKALQEYIGYKPEEYILECNGTIIETKSFLITCANASQWGNNAFIAPNASVTDGLIDVITMEPFNIIDAAPLAFQLFTKTIEKRHNIKMYRANEFTIHRKEGTIYHYDGEPVEMDKTVVIRNIHAGLKILIP